MTTLNYTLSYSSKTSVALNDLLKTDIDCISKQKDNPWGSNSKNLVSKFYQYDELGNLPVFDKMLLNNLGIKTISLFVLDPDQHVAISTINDHNSEHIDDCFLVIPLDNISISWINPYKVKSTASEHVREEFKNHNISYHNLNVSDMSVLIKNQSKWVVVKNNSIKKSSSFLLINFQQNPRIEDIYNILK